MNIPKIRPRGKQILVKPEEEQSRESENGIVTPDNIEQESKAMGEVIAVGPEITDIKAGDKVIYGAFAGEAITLSNTGKDIDFIILYDDHVLAVIE